MASVFRDAGYSPPEIHESDSPVSLSDVEQLVSHHVIHDKATAGWEDMTKAEKPKMGFVKLRGYDSMLENGWDEKYKYLDIMKRSGATTPWEALKLALDETTTVGAHLQNVMRSGGDVGLDFESELLTLESVLEKFPAWKDSKTAPTIFNGGGPMDLVPLYRVQSDKSTLCYMIALPTAIYYENFNPDHPLDSLDNIVNVNHYVRNVFHKERSFRYIFLGDGDYSSDTLTEMLQHWNPEKQERDLTEALHLNDAKYTNNTDFLYNIIKMNLKFQGAAVMRIQVFQELLDNPEQIIWTGPFDDMTRLDLKKYTYDGHALVMVGARRTIGEHGGIQFLAQNS